MKFCFVFGGRYLIELNHKLILFCCLWPKRKTKQINLFCAYMSRSYWCYDTIPCSLSIKVPSRALGFFILVGVRLDWIFCFVAKRCLCFTCSNSSSWVNSQKVIINAPRFSRLFQNDLLISLITLIYKSISISNRVQLHNFVPISNPIPGNPTCY